ncbi:DUF5054 domain-containing protein [Bacteroides salyersiae]|nr:DUF5054 domain-containing protein [Bacteroides salyersiae]
MAIMKKLTFLFSFFWIFVLFPVRAETPDGEITQIRLIFKTHLDIGFTDLGDNVLNTYINDFIPAALDLSEEITEGKDGYKYPWTTGAWLLWEYMEKSSPKNKQRIEEAIQRNDFFWHAFPFTIEAELCDSSLFAAAFDISHRLDRQFKRHTISAKITDVPGISRSVIPIMRKQGIFLLHIGTNPCIPLPKLPTLFRWRNTDGSEINVIYQLGYGEFLKLPGTKTAAFLCFTSDNHGPHTKEQIAELYANIKKRFPKADIIASSLDDVARDIELYCQDELPVVTQEIGDSWIWGVASDPKKIAEFRTLMRLRTDWVNTGRLIPGSDLDMRFSLPLLLVSEHTWGLDVKWNLHNWDKYAPAEFEKFQRTETFQRMEASWNEKRRFITSALATLPADMQREAYVALSTLNPTIPDRTGYEWFDVRSKVVRTKWFNVMFHPETGALMKLEDKETHTDWADGEHTLGEFAYQTFSEDVFKNFIAQYCPPNPPDWAKLDYGKHQLAATGTPHKTWVYQLLRAYSKKEKQGTSVILELGLPQRDKFVYGAPQTVYLKYTFPFEKKQIEVELGWFDKKKNRVPEALWYSFTPLLSKASTLLLNKMGTEVDVTDVVENGSRHMHAVTGDIKISDGGKRMRLYSWDAPLVVLNDRDIMYFDNEPAEPSKGVNFCLFNNTWGTNYPQWFGDDMKFRFSIFFE